MTEKIRYREGEKGLKPGDKRMVWNPLGLQFGETWEVCEVIDASKGKYYWHQLNSDGSIKGEVTVRIKKSDRDNYDSHRLHRGEERKGAKP